MAEEELSRLLVLWTSGEKLTALNMVLMYTYNAKAHDWWSDITLLIWGAASHLVAEDREVQEQVTAAREAGVRVIACKKCAENLGVVEVLEGLGIEVFYTGEFLTAWLKSGDRILSV
jgi:hypothetical protein